MTKNADATSNWGHVDLTEVPDIKVPPPGPASQALHARCTKHFKGLSTQVKLFPVAFESGEGCTLVDADGNKYIDFSSGIYVTTLGHCHPKVTEAVQKYAGQLMNCHDFSTEIKTRLVEKLASILPGDLTGFQFYDSGTTAVEAGMRVMRAASGGKQEMISCFYDYHGKSYGAVSLGHVRSFVYGPVRAPGMHMVPRPAPTARCSRSRTARSTPTSSSPSTTSTSTRPPCTTSPASCSNPCRAGAARSSRPTTSSPSSAPTATARACC